MLSEMAILLGVFTSSSEVFGLIIFKLNVSTGQYQESGSTVSE